MSNTRACSCRESRTKLRGSSEVTSLVLCRYIIETEPFKRINSTVRRKFTKLAKVFGHWPNTLDLRGNKVFGQKIERQYKIVAKIGNFSILVLCDKKGKINQELNSRPASFELASNRYTYSTMFRRSILYIVKHALFQCQISSHIKT